MANHFYKIIKHNAMMCDHRKYGLYNPVIDYFKDAIKFYDVENGVYVDGKDMSMSNLGAGYIRQYQVENVDVPHLIQMIKSDLEGKGTLRNAIIKSVNGSLGNRLGIIYGKSANWYTDFEEYKTNATSIKLKVQIGFDPVDLEDLVAFNGGEAVNSCQIASNKMTYAFGLIDLVVNPHLLFLIRDENDTIIGRSIIRIWHHKGDDSNMVYIAPSRVYLSKYTHAKRAIYNEVFAGVQGWAKIQYGDNFRLIAYSNSNHDSPVYSYLDRQQWGVSQEAKPGRLDTEMWHPFWHERPYESDSRLTYYQDERMSDEHVNIFDPNLNHQSYAVMERLSTQSYEIISEVNKTNE
jgi:hypothetical protein